MRQKRRREGWEEYHFFRPNHILLFQPRAIPDLQRATRSTREELLDLLPRQSLVLFQIHHQVIVILRERFSLMWRYWSRVRHSRHAHEASLAGRIVRRPRVYTMVARSHRCLRRHVMVVVLLRQCHRSLRAKAVSRCCLLGLCREQSIRCLGSLCGSLGWESRQM